jgi:GAF domain-containing protein
LTSGIRLSEQEILELIYEQATPLMDTSDMYIALYEPDPSQPDEYNFENPEKSIIHGTVRFGLAMDNKRQVDTEHEKGWGPRKAGHGLTEHVIRTRQPYRPSDVKKAYETIATEYIGKIPKSWMGVPVMIENEVLGVVVLRNDEYENVYGEDDEEVLQAIAGQAAVAIDNAKLYYHLEERVQERTQQIAALQEIGTKITSQLKLEEVLGSIAENANIITSADFSTLFPYDSNQEKFESGIRKGKIEVEPSIPSNTGLAARIARTQKAVFAEDAEKQPGVKPTFIKARSVKSFAGVPLIIGGKTVGILYVNFFEPHRFSKEEQETIRLLANQAAVAIGNARLYETLEQRARQLEEAQAQIAETEAVLARASIATDFVHRINNLAGTTPLWIDLATEQLLPSDLRDERLKGYLQKIKEDFAGLLRAAEELDKPPREEDFDVTFLLEAMLRNVETQYLTTIAIDKELEPDLYHVRAIPTELRNAIWNVITNGIEAMPKGGKLTVKARNYVDEQQKKWIRIVIEDIGGGIPPDELTSMFKLFHTTKGEGRGYGSWRAKNVIEGLGGTISVESEVNVGTTFAIALPAAPSTEEQHR